MFKKLKIKFILINMSLLSIVFITIFSSIYLIFNSSINRETNMTIETLFNDYGGPKPKPNSSNIIINLNKDNTIESYITHLNGDLTVSQLESYVKTVVKRTQDRGKITIDDENFMYAKRSFKDKSKIVFLNISYEESLKLRLLQVFIFSSIAALIILFFISVYLTNKSIQPIKDTFEKQKQFIADASHELKTPLTIIKTNTSLVLSNPDDTIKNQSKWIKYIEDQANRMSFLVNEMLSLAKLDIAENKLILSNINISEIIKTMILNFEAIIFENNITLEDNILDNIYIKGDEDSIRKLFSILIDNAIKYTNKNGLISIKLYKDKTKIKLSITNTGEGIEPQNLNNIFERFYRVDNSRDRKTGGYGLGLSIAKSIVEQHKGKIYAESELKKYTKFIVEFPYFIH